MNPPPSIEIDGFSLSVDASMSDDMKIRFSSVVEEIDEVYELLQTYRREAYLDKESVYDITAKGVAEDLNKPNFLPDVTLEHIEGLNNFYWGNVYQDVVLGRNDSPPLDWVEAFRERDAPESPNEFIVPVDDVEPIRVNGRPAVEIPLRSGSKVIVKTEQDISGFLIGKRELALNYHPPAQLKMIKNLTNYYGVSKHIGSNFSVSLSNFPPRYTLNEKGPIDETRGMGLIRSLRDIENPFNDKYEMGIICDVITSGIFGTRSQLKWALLLSGTKDAVFIPSYSRVSPYVDEIAETLNSDITAIPQIGGVVVHRNSDVPEIFDVEWSVNMSPFRHSLPEESHRELLEWLDFPEPSIDEVMDEGVVSQLRGKEYIAQLFDSEAINKKEIHNYRWVEWPPVTNKSSLFHAIDRGKSYRENIRDFDSKYNVDLHNSIIKRIESKVLFRHQNKLL